MTFCRTLIIAALLLAGVATSQAWLRRSFTDAEIVSRAELMVIGHIKDGSLVRIAHGNGSSWEHHVELVIDEVLKGQCLSNSMIVSIHYGLDPITNGGAAAVELWDTGNSVLGGPPVSGDLRANQIWLLRQVKNAVNEDTDWIGIYDPEDIQPLSQKAELVKYLPTDPIDDLVAKLSADGGLWKNGSFQPVQLPETAPSGQLVQQILAMHQIKNYTLLNLRTVHIRGSVPDAYTAALIRTGPSENIVLFNFAGTGLGWWNRVYDPVLSPDAGPAGNLLKNFNSITNGMTRAEVEKRLKMDGGMQGVPLVRYFDPQCPGYKINIEFDIQHNAADQNRAFGSSDDKVIRVSIPYHEPPCYD
jgi:hypothetical protein